MCIIIGNGIILKKTFAPLQKLLQWIHSVIPGKLLPPLDNETPITEFSQLNTAVLDLSKRNLDAYRQQKNFLENAAYELQTPLAIAANKIEFFAQNENLKENHLNELDEIYRTLNKAVRLNKSLLLLSRIENRQFEERTSIDLIRITREIIADMKDIYIEKNLGISIPEPEERICLVQMNEALAQILLSNLIKNAFVHTPSGGKINIEIRSDAFTIRNSGEKPLDETKIFRRFYRSENTDPTPDSTGLGLAIVQSIVASNGMKMGYVFDGEHVFSIKPIFHS